MNIGQTIIKYSLLETERLLKKKKLPPENPKILCC